MTRNRIRREIRRAKIEAIVERQAEKKFMDQYGSILRLSKADGEAFIAHILLHYQGTCH